MLLIDRMAQKKKEQEEKKKTFYCPLKGNRSVDDSGGEKPYRRVDELDRSEEELQKGKLIKIKGFPRDYKVRLFRVVVHSRRTEWIVTNDLSRDSAHEAREVRGVGWKIEEFQREAEQLTGIEGCQCRVGASIATT